MKKLLFLLLMVSILDTVGYCSAPTRPNTYVSGTVIDPNAVTGNEVPLYTYLQAGVDTYKNGSIAQAAISSTAGILYSQLNLAGGILPTDINISTTTSIYTFQNIAIPYTATVTGGIVDNGTFNLGITHTGDILYDNGSSFVRRTGGTSGQPLVAQGSATAPIYTTIGVTGISGALGTWTAGFSDNTANLATTDLWVVLTINTTSGTPMSDTILTDVNNPPTTARAQAGGNGTFATGTACFVRKGDYWKTATNNVSSNSLYAISLGS